MTIVTNHQPKLNRLKLIEIGCNQLNRKSMIVLNDVMIKCEKKSIKIAYIKAF
jgi:hypothetical protein